MTCRFGSLILAGMLAALAGCSGGNTSTSVELLNVSYDPTRELWREINAAFIPEYEKTIGKSVEIKQSHGGSTSQARAVVDGLEADVVTLALWPDTDAIRRKGLINEKWEQRLPERSSAYFSTIVFVVRKGNPKNIRDWQDLAKEGVGVITPNPKTSGNGKLSFLAAWGDAKKRGLSDDDAEAFIRKVYRNVLVLDTGARGATVTFAQRNLGDVHLTWENEAHLEIEEAKGTLELVYPKTSIKAEPYIAVVDKNVDRRGTRAAAEAYLKLLYTDAGQEIIAKHYYRPIKTEVLKKHESKFPAIDLFSVESFAKDWDDVQARFFAEGAVFDRIYSKQNKK